MKIVLIGKNGQLGWELQCVLPALGKVISLGRRELDLAAPGTVQETIRSLHPDLIINASAYTEVDLAETQVELAMRVNATAPGELAEVARKIGAVFVHYSTDYVFDGKNTRPYTEADSPNPINVYGKSKYLGEQNIQQAGGSYLTFRTSWVYSLRGNSFVNKVLGWSRKNTTLKIVSDQISNPTWARTLAVMTCLALVKYNEDLFEKIGERRGIYHLAGTGYTSRFDWARQILAYDPDRTEQLVQAIEPASSEEFPTPAVRPLYSALDCAHFERVFGLQMPEWNSMLKLAMAE
jgi:dTDP-4-dehydrorhamnose reductase